MRLPNTDRLFFRHAFFTVIAFGLIGFAEYLGFFVGISNYLYDLSFRIRGPLPVNKHIVIAVIDEKTLNKLGRWPLRRIQYANLIEHLHQSKAVGFDIIMSEPSEDDDVLDSSMKKHGRVVLPLYLDSNVNVIQPSSSLVHARTGHIHIEQGIDGIVRKAFHVISCKDKVIPSLSSVIYQMAFPGMLPYPPTITRQEKTSGIGIFQKEPVNINFYGPAGAFQQVSLLDILEGRYPEGFFRDTIVLVGVTAPGIETKMLVPFTQRRDRMSGVEVHANLLNNLIDKNDIKDVPGWIHWTGIFILSFVLFLLFPGLNERLATIIWLLVLAGITVLSYLLFLFFNLWMTPATFYFPVTFIFIITYIYRIERIGKLLFFAKEEWKNTFHDINDAIIVHDSEFAILRANRAAEEIVQRPFFNLIREKWNERFHAVRFAGSIDSASSAVSEPVTDVIHDQERDRYFEIKTIPRLDAKNNMIGAIEIIRDITERKYAEEALKTSEEQLRNLTAYLHKVAEVERTNIAREIHDELGSDLTVLKIDLTWLKMKIPKEDEKLHERIHEMSQVIDKTIKTMKRISTDLRPGLLDDLGLSAAIEWQAEEFQKRTGIECEIHVDTKTMTADRDRDTAIFRIFQETLTNIARHAGATKAVIQLTADAGEIALQVRDNGRGITEEELTNPKAFGLIGMRERVKIFGGNITIQGSHGEGTRVTVKIPAQDTGRDH